jgi:hypothetical protein
MWRSRAAAELRQDWPSGNAPTTRVRRRISLIIRSSALFFTNLLPMDVRKGVAGQRLGHALLDEICSRRHPGGAQIVDDRLCLPIGRFLAFLGVDGLEQISVAIPGIWERPARRAAFRLFYEPSCGAYARSSTLLRMNSTPASKPDTPSRLVFPRSMTERVALRGSFEPGFLRIRNRDQPEAWQTCPRRRLAEPDAWSTTSVLFAFFCPKRARSVSVSRFACLYSSSPSTQCKTRLRNLFLQLQRNAPLRLVS